MPPGALLRRLVAGHLSPRSSPIAAAAAAMSTTPTPTTPKSVAVVGGGVAGLVCARELSARGHRVTVFDLGRAAPGGRASTRTTSWRTVQFDHGAQVLSVPPPPPSPTPSAAAAPSSFGALVESWRREGLVAPWGGDGEDGDNDNDNNGRVGVYDATTGAYAPRAVWAASGGAGAGAVGSASAAAAAGSTPPATAPNFFLGLIAGAAPSSSASLPRLYVGTPSTDALCKGLARALEEEEQQQQQQQQQQQRGAAAATAIRQGVGVSRARFDPRARTWVLEGRAPEKPLRSHADRRATPAYTPWNEGAFDALVLADRMAGARGTPGFVELEGAGGAGSRLSEALAAVRLSPCLVLMLAYEDGGAAAGAADAKGDGDNGPPLLPLPLDGWDAAAVVGGAGAGKIAWVCRDSSKPGRARQDGLQTYVAVATPSFSAEVLAGAYSEAGAPAPGKRADGSWPPQTAEYLSALVAPMRRALEEALRPALLRRQERRARGGGGGAAAAAAVGFPEPAFAQVHRWGSAFPEAGAVVGAPCLRADGAALAACGDFCLGGGIEGAALSGQAAAAAVAEMLAASSSSLVAEGGGGGGGDSRL